MYLVLVLLGGGGGTAWLTDNLPVGRGEYSEHLVAYETQSTEISSIKDSLTAIQLQQVKQALKDAYKDRCRIGENDQALMYIDREIDELQDQHIDLTARPGFPGRRYQPPPCQQA